MRQYKELVEYVIQTGERRSNRTGIDTMAAFGYMFIHDLQQGFPLLTSKKMDLSKIAGELRWFLDGNTKPSQLNSKIWDNWQYNDDIGPMYGAIWRKYPMIDGSTFDQIKALIENLKTNPNSRRHIMTTLHLSCVADERVSPQENVKAGRGALWPCHGLVVQCNVRNGKFLDLIMFQRSCDIGLGAGYNIASYGLLTHILANEVGLQPGILKIVLGDLHIYENHMVKLLEQIKRPMRALPTLNQKLSLDFDPENIELIGYNPHDSIKYDIAV